MTLMILVRWGADMGTTTTIDFDDLVREQRFEELVRTQRRRAVGIVFRHIGNWADAEEAVQEALARMWTDRTRMDAVDNLAGWLINEAKYKARTLAAERRKAAPSPLGEHIERVEAQQLEPSSLPCTADPEVMARIRVALAAMTPTQRAVVQAHCLHGMSVAETAEKIGTTRHAVHQALYTALHHVDLSGPEWRDHHAEIGVESPEAKVFRASPKLVRMLPARQRQAVRLRYVKGLSTADAGKRMGISAKQVSNLTNDARRFVRELMPSLVSA